jgi:hypothetical protein
MFPRLDVAGPEFATDKKGQTRNFLVVVNDGLN